MSEKMQDRLLLIFFAICVMTGILVGLLLRISAILIEIRTILEAK